MWPPDWFGDPEWRIVGVVIAVAWVVMLFEDGPGWLILKRIVRVALCALMVPLAFLAWYMATAIPVSVAILLGAGIIAITVRSSAGRVRRLTAQPQDAPEPARRDYPYSISDR